MMAIAQVKAAMLAKAEQSLVTPALAAKLKFKPCTAKECAELGLPAAKAGFVIPYFDAAGKVTSFFRYRYLEDTRSGFAALGKRKPLRYGQPSNTLNEVYMPPLVHGGWKAYLANADAPLVITEGELKAACATLSGVPTLGLGGVWCFMSSKRGKGLLPQLEQVKWEERTVYICYDSDAATNPDIIRAENALARELTQRGAVVFITRLPPGEDGKKVGLDDYLLEHEVGDLTRLLTTSAEYSTCTALRDFNSKVVYIRNPGFVFSYEHEMRMSCTDFVNHAYVNVWHEEMIFNAKGESKLQKMATAKEWLKWPYRAELRAMTYAPGQPKVTDDSKLNSWVGWGLEPQRGDVAPWHAMMTHFFGNDKAARRWFECWCAYPLQHPGVKMMTSAVIWSVAHGSGKSLIAYTLARIYGDNFAELKNEDFEDPRNEWAENKQFVLGDDVTGHDSRRLSRRFMTMVTQKTIRLNPKYIPSYSIPDCINYYFTSNDPNAFYMDDDDRRFFIWEVLAGRLDIAFRDKYIAWMNGEGASALFYYLLTLDLKDFDPFAPALVTTAKREMQHVSKSDLGSWVASLKEAPEIVLNGKLKGDLFTAQELHMLYDPLGDKKASVNALARELTHAGFVRPLDGSPVRTEAGLKRLFAVRNGEQWRVAAPKAVAEHYSDTRAVKRKF